MQSYDKVSGERERFCMARRIGYIRLLLALCLAAPILSPRPAAAADPLPGDACTAAENAINTFQWNPTGDNGTPSASGVTNAIFCIGNVRKSMMNFQAATGYVGIGNTAPGSMLDVGKAGTTLGTLRLEGNTSGYVQLQPAAAAGSWTMTLPPNAGTSGYVLRTDGAGVTTWVAQSGGGTTLDAITAAAGAQAGIANGNNPIVWNWAQTTAGQTGMAFGETTAATSTGTPYLASFTTLAASTATPLKISDSLTDSQTLPALSILPTWNTTGVVDAALLINATNTASGTGSKLIDAQIGGATQFSVDKTGTMSLASVTGANAPTSTTTANYSEMSGNSNGGTLAAGATKYGPANGIFTMTATAPVVAAATASMVSRAATVQNLYYSVGIAANANAHTVTVFKNGASTALTCAVANAATTCNDITHSFSVVAGDYLSIRVVTAASAAVGTAAWSIELSY